MPSLSLYAYGKVKNPLEYRSAHQVWCLLLWLGAHLWPACPACRRGRSARSPPAWWWSSCTRPPGRCPSYDCWGSSGSPARSTGDLDEERETKAYQKHTTKTTHLLMTWCASMCICSPGRWILFFLHFYALWWVREWEWNRQGGMGGGGEDMKQRTTGRNQEPGSLWSGLGLNGTLSTR